MPASSRINTSNPGVVGLPHIIRPGRFPAQHQLELVPVGVPDAVRQGKQPRIHSAHDAPYPVIRRSGRAALAGQLRYQAVDLADLRRPATQRQTLDDLNQLLSNPAAAPIGPRRTHQPGGTLGQVPGQPPPRSPQRHPSLPGHRRQQRTVEQAGTEHSHPPIQLRQLLRRVTTPSPARGRAAPRRTAARHAKQCAQNASPTARKLRRLPCNLPAGVPQQDRLSDNPGPVLAACARRVTRAPDRTSSWQSRTVPTTSTRSHTTCEKWWSESGKLRWRYRLGLLPSSDQCSKRSEPIGS